MAAVAMATECLRYTMRLLLLLVILLPPVAAQAAMQTVTLQLKWKHQFQFAGYYMALEKGYYRQAGLDVKLIEGRPDLSPVDHVIGGEGRYGIADAGVLLDRAAGKPVKALAALFQHSPLVLVVRKDSGIRSWADLRGKRIMVQSGSMHAQILAALKRAGLSAGDFVRQDSSYDINDLIDGRTDAFSSYLTNEPYRLQQLGIGYRVLDPADLGIDFYGDTLIASDAEVKKHPERVQAFVEASMRGWQYALDHIEESIDLIMLKYNTQGFTHDKYLFEAQAMQGLVLRDLVQLGYMNSYRWQQIANVYGDLGLLQKQADVKGLLYRPEPGFVELLGRYRWQILGGVLLLLLAMLAVHSAMLRRAVRVRTAELRRSEEKFSRLFHTSKDGVLLAATDGTIIDANRAALVQFGLSLTAICERSVPSLLAEGGMDTWAKVVRDCGDRGFAHFEALFGGQAQPFSGDVYANPVEIEAGQLIQLMIRDISERIAAERALRESEQRFANIINLAHDAVISIDEEQRIVLFNKAAEEAFGYSQAEVLGRDVGMLLPQRFRQQHGRLVREYERKAPKIAVMHAGREVVGQRKDGREFPVEASISSFEREGQKVLTVFLKDVSEHRHLEEQLRQSQKMEAIGTLVGGIAHDFNNVLAGINGNLFIARREIGDNPVAVDKLANVEKLVFRASEMIRQLLVFARKDVVEKRVFDLAAFMKEVIRLSESAIPESIRLIREIGVSEMFVNGDPTQLEQALLNLLNNARDALQGRPEPQICITLERLRADAAFRRRHPDARADVYAHLSVSDNGAGIREADLAHVLEPFFTTKEVGKGTGLGLPMVYGAVQGHQGVLQIDSREGVGTTVHLYLPEAAGRAANAPLADEQVVSGHGEVILLVDDEAMLRETSCAVLESLGYHVLQAADGLDAVALFEARARDIDLVLMDIVMPRMSGVHAARHIREIRPDIPVIFITGYDREEVLKDEAIQEDPVLNKPFYPPRLSQLIREVLDRADRR